EIVHTEYALAAFEPLSISGTSQEDTIVRADRGHAVPAPAMERSEAYARSNPGESLQDESSTATTPPERDLEIAPEYDPEPEFSPGGSEPLAAPSVAVDSPRIDPPVASAAVAPVAPTRAQSTEPESSDPAASEVDVWIDPAAEVIEQQDREAAERQIPPFQCAWEVDQFDLPARVSELFLDGELFGQLTERLADAVSSGLRSMLMTASHRGEGCSTVAMGIAVAAAAAGIKTALVDADLKDPTLADDLRLDMEFGWVESLRGSLSIDEVAIQSVTDALTLIPLIPNRQAPAATAGEATNVIAQLAPHFDLIVIDAGHQSESVMAELAKHIETAIVVRDPNRTTPAQVNQLAYKLREAGAKGIGVVENFS
ncbi:MAG: division plane positioning ATPase MipZ, partial [Planctomycetota bacterium]